MVSLQQIKESLKDKMSEEEFNKKVQEFTEDAKEFGVEEGEHSNYIIRRFASFFTKLSKFGNRLERIDNAEMIFIAKNKTDYGKSFRYKEAMEKKNIDFNKALSEGWIDSEGRPLTKGTSIQPTQPINLEDFDICYYGLIKVEKEWKKAMLTVKNLQNPGYRIPLFTPLMGTVGKRTSQPENVDVALGLVMNAELKERQRLDIQSMKSLINHHFKDYIVDIKDIDMGIDDFKQKYLTGYNKFNIIIGDADDGIETKEENGSSWIKLTIPLTEEEVMKNNFIMPQVQCWMNKEDKDVEKNIKAGAIDIIAMGRINLSENPQFGKQLSMNNSVIYADDKFILKEEEKAQEVTPTNGNTEKADENQFA